MVCDPSLSRQLKSASYTALKRITDEDPGDVPVLMSGAGHDAMAMSHLTKVSYTQTLYFTTPDVIFFRFLIQATLCTYTITSYIGVSKF